MSVYRRANEPYQVGDISYLNELGTADSFTVYEPQNHWPEAVFVGSGGTALEAVEIGTRAIWALQGENS